MAHHCKTHEKALPAPGSRGVGLGQSADTHQPPRQTLTVHTTSGNGVHALDDTCSPFLDQVSDFHWWFLERPQTSMAASSREPFSFNQADSTPRISVGPICSISIGTSSSGNCSCSSHRVYLEGWLELASSSWATKLTGSDVGWERVFLRRDVSREVIRYHVVLFDALFFGNDFHVTDCTAETLAIEYAV